MIKPNLSFEVEKANNLLHCRKEDMKGWKEGGGKGIFHIPGDIICDYTLEYRFIYETFLISNFVTWATKGKWEICSSRFAEERTEAERVFSPKEKLV